MENFICECGKTTKYYSETYNCKCGKVYNSKFQLIYSPTKKELKKELYIFIFENLRTVLFLCSVIIIFIVAISNILKSNTSHSPTFEENTKRGIEKSYTGAPMTKAEKNAANSYFKWEKEEKAKEYNKNTYGK